MSEKNKDWTQQIAEKLRTGSDKVPSRVWDTIQRDINKTPRSSNKTVRRWITYTSGIAALVALILTLYPLLDKKADITPGITIPHPPVAEIADNVSCRKTKEFTKYIKPVSEKHITKNNFIAARTVGDSKATIACSDTTVSENNAEHDTIVVSENIRSYQTERNINGKEYAYEQEINHYGKTKNHNDNWSIGLSGSALAMASNNNSSKKLFSIPSQSLEQDGGSLTTKPSDTYYKYEHFQPISVGVSATLSIGHGLQLGTGINYTLLHSRATMAIDNSTKDQKLHMIGIPVSLTWSFINKEKFSSYIGIEAMGEKCVSASFGDKKVDEKGLQFSIGGLVGIQYRILPNFAVYAEPKLNHYFTKTDLRTIRTDKNVIFNIQFGLRFTY